MSKFTPQLNEVLKNLKPIRKPDTEWMDLFKTKIYKRKDGSLYAKIPKK